MKFPSIWVPSHSLCVFVITIIVSTSIAGASAVFPRAADLEGVERPIHSSTATLVPARSSIDINERKRTELSTSIFIGPLYMYCPDPYTVLDQGPSEEALRVSGLARDMWLPLTSPFVRRKEKVQSVRSRMNTCKTYCGCDQNTGEIIRDVTKAHCEDELQAKRCTWVYRCYCRVDLSDPEDEISMNPAHTLEDFQAALNRVPQFVRDRNPNYSWLVPDHLRSYYNHRLTWGNGVNVEARPTEPPTVGYNAGWLPQEPFYVHGQERYDDIGPGNDYVRGWEFYNQPGGGSGGGGFFYKRSPGPPSTDGGEDGFPEDNTAVRQNNKVEEVDPEELAQGRRRPVY